MSIEQEIQAKGLTAPRITPQHIASVIEREVYFTAGNAADTGFTVMDPMLLMKHGNDPLNQLTFCVLVLKNGFTVTGESACASPENFDAEIGRKIARQNAEHKIWTLMGYALKQQLHVES